MSLNIKESIAHHFDTKSQEYSQALVRLILMVFFSLYLSLYYNLHPEQKIELPFLVAVIIYFLYCLALILHINVLPAFNQFRHYFSIVFDMTLIGVGMYMGGIVAAFFYGGYLWLVLGNGVRFGRRSLYITMVLAFISFSIVIVVSEFWQNNLEFGLGLLVWLILLPPYISRLIKQKDIALERAQFADSAKSRFLTNMSHELRTPLNGIIGYSEMIYEDGVGIEEAQLSARKINSSAMHLLSLINELLDMASIEAEKMKVDVEEVNLDHLLNEVLGLVEVLSKKYNIHIVVGGEFSVLVLADRLRLKQVVVNLLSNAIKYNKVDGSVRIYSGVHDGVATLRICDDGPGLSQEEQKIIFNPFERLKESASTNEGAGIGLMIAKNLVRLMGGEIGVESVKGSGSCFWISLPVVKD